MGLDFSSHMLAVCRARLAQEPEAVRSRVELAHGDMRSFDLGKAFALVHEFPFRYLFKFEAEHLLARSGFEVEHVYAGYDKSPYGSVYPGELIFAARRAA
jgi:hypothetical protein